MAKVSAPDPAAVIATLEAMKLARRYHADRPLSKCPGCAEWRAIQAALTALRQGQGLQAAEKSPGLVPLPKEWRHAGEGDYAPIPVEPSSVTRASGDIGVSLLTELRQVKAERDAVLRQGQELQAALGDAVTIGMQAEAERDAARRQVAQVPAEIEQALKEFDRLVVDHMQAQGYPEGTIESYVTRSDVLHILVHLRARVLALLPAPRGET